MNPEIRKIYHYTSFKNAIEIIRSGELYLSHVMYMNDRREFIYAAKKFIELIDNKEKEFTDIILGRYVNDEIREYDLDYVKRLNLFTLREILKAELFSKYSDEILDKNHYISKGYSDGTTEASLEFTKLVSIKDIYVSSFSLIEDDLVMWRLYSENAYGACIEFSFDNNNQPFEVDYNKNYLLLAPLLYPKVLDFEKEIKDFIENYLNKLSLDINQNSELLIPTHLDIMYKLLKIKNHIFEFENEARIIYYGQAENQNIDYLNLGSYLKPIYKLKLDKEIGKSSLKINSLILGPLNDISISDISLSMFLDSKGINLRKSVIDCIR
jgi:hypothetical protein